MNKHLLVVVISILLLQTISLTAQNASWIQQSPPVTQTLSDVAVLSPGIIVAVGNSGTIIKSTDSGTTWAKKNSATSKTLNGVDFVNGSVGYAVGESGTILKSTDSGETWVEQTSGVSTTLYSVSFVSKDMGWATGFKRTVLKTTDGGITWTSQYSAATLTFLEDADAISQQNAVAVGWGSGDFNKTTDGGLTWTGSDLAGWAKGVDFLNDTLGWVAGITASYISVTESWGDIYTTINGKKATVWKTQNSGLTWTPYVFANNAQWLYDVTAINPEKVFAVGEKGLITYTADGGLNWTLQNDPRFANVSFNAIAFESSSTGYIVGANGTILKTENGGISWTQKGISGTTNYLNSVFFINSATGCAAGNKGTIVKTTDGGKNWNVQLSGISGIINSVCFTDSLTGWCSVNDGTILHTVNGGTTWTNQVSGVTSDLLSVHFTDKNNGWAAGSNGTIIHTTNGGSNWTLQPSGTTAYLYSLFFINSTTGWAGGSNGTILKTINGGVSWTETEIQNSDSYSIVNDIFFIDEKTGWCIGDWIMKTTDGGDTWVKQFGNMNEYYEFRRFCALYFIDAQTGWISATNGKILKTTDSGKTWGIASVENNSDYFDIRFINSLTGWAVGYDGYIMKTGNGGGTFTPMEYLDIPTLTEPEDRSYNTSRSPTLRWKSAGQGSLYEVQLATDDIYQYDSIITFVSGLTDTFLVIDRRLQPDEFHNWKVRLVGNNGIKGNWSKQFSFKTQPIPDCIPTLYSPWGDDESDKFKVYFHWYCYLADSFRIQVSTDSTFTKNLKVDSVVNATNINLLLDQLTTYYWRVKQKWENSPREWSKSGTYMTPEIKPFITIDRPGYYEGLAIGTVYTITWTDNISTRLQVSLYKNSVFLFEIGYTLSNSIDWSILPSLTPGNDYTIMVKDTLSGTFTQSGFFRVNQPYISISDPFSLAKWAKGLTNYEIIWSDNLPGNLMVLLYKAGIVVDTLGVSESNIQSFYWDIPASLSSGSDYQIIIKDTSTGISGTSSFFSIEDPYINIQHPQSGTELVKGREDNGIDWNDNSPNNLLILLYKTGIFIDTVGITENQYTSYFSWIIPENLPAGTDYSILIKDTITNISGTSELFSILDPFIRVDDPVPGIEWQRGTMRKFISWSSNYYDFQMALILLYKGDVLLDTLGFTVNQHFYFWDIPVTLTLGTDYRIAVKDTAKNITGISGFFTITESAAVIPGVPVLLGPINGLTDQPGNFSLIWNPVSGAVNYSVQVSVASDFSNTFINQSGLTATNYQPDGLANGTKYYWRVNATNAGGTSAWSETWNFFTISVPNQPTMQASNLVASGITGNSATVKWTKGNGSRSVLFVKQGTDGVPEPTNNTSYISDAGFGKGSQTGSSGWYCVYLGSDSTVTITGLSSRTTYKAMAISFNGNAGDEKYLRQTVAGNPATFTTTCDYDYYGTNPEVHLYYKNATTYDVEISNAHTCGSTTLKFLNATLTANAFNITVNAYPNSGTMNGILSSDGSSFSGTYNIVYAMLHPIYGYSVPCGTKSGSWSASRQSSALPPPVLNSPDNNAMDQPVSLLLKWNPSAGAVSYSLQVSKSSDFSTLFISPKDIISTQYSLSGLENSATYYWRISSSDNCYSSGWSETRSFTTVPVIPDTPVLSLPANNSTNQPVSLSLSWNTSARAVSYSIEVSTKSDFSTTVANQTGLTTVSYSPSGLANGTKYYWRVNATNTGGTTAWCGEWNFTTSQSLPDVPALVGPASGTTNQPLSFTLVWNAAARADYYQLQLSTKSDFSTTIADENNLTATLKPISGLANSTLYYWRVRAVNSGGNGNWSETWNFTTINATGIDESEMDGFVRIYPNPVKAKIIVEFNQPVRGESEIKLYEVSGRIILTQKLVSLKNEINVSNLTSGIYIAEIRTGISVCNRKLVIQ